jgi:hypothetical protein
MFVHQGARQLELWTGQPPPVRIMRDAVLAALASQANESAPNDGARDSNA